MEYNLEKEKREAVEAGQRALNSLRAAQNNLNSAKNWGIFDMFGGGMFSTFIKNIRWKMPKTIWSRQREI